MNLLTVVGNRPQFIKAAPVSRALKAAGVSERLLHTGQHYDARMSDVFFTELDLPKPKYQLHIGSGPHGKQTGEMLIAVEEVLTNSQQDAVLVYGDTNSTLAGALAAAKLGVPVFHVEAGLRSYNRDMPEEINRVMTDHLSDLLFCPTAAAIGNLDKEGVFQGVYQTGDVMLDAACLFGSVSEKHSDFLHRLHLERGEFTLVTLHRAENTDSLDRLSHCIKNLARLAESEQVVFAMHPRTSKQVEKFGLGDKLGNIRVVEPLSFLDMIEAIRASRVVVTDSGGLQKEAYFHETPCVTIRGETEWVETLDAGWNQLLAPDSIDFVDRVRSAKPGSGVISDYGDGNAAGKIADIVTAF